MYDAVQFVNRTCVQRSAIFYENSAARARSREVGFSYDLFPEISQPVINQNVPQIVPEAKLLPQPLANPLSKNPKKQKNRKLIAVPKNRRCSFLDPEMKTRLAAAIKAYHQIKEDGATFLLVNGSMTEKIIDISVVCDQTKISHKTWLNRVTPGRISKSSFGCGYFGKFSRAADCGLCSLDVS